MEQWQAPLSAKVQCHPRKRMGQSPTRLDHNPNCLTKQCGGKPPFLTVRLSR